MCVSHRCHVTSHLKQRGDSWSRADTHTHTDTQTSCQLSSDKGPECACAAARGIALAKFNIRQQVKSYLIEPKSPARPPAPHSIVFASRNRARQNGSTELAFHTVTVCFRLLDSIKTSQIRAPSSSMYFMQRRANTAVWKTQIYAKNPTWSTLPPFQDTVLHHY